MHIAVLAANGRTGEIFVKQALAAGHTVRAGVYGTNNLSAHHRLKVIQCDATNESDVTNLLRGQQAVASFIGHTKNSAPDVQTRAMRVLATAMKKLRLKRIVSLTGTGVRFPGDDITFIDRVLNLAIGIIDPARVNDGRNHVNILQASNLDWTVIRVLKLHNGTPKPFQLSAHGPTKWHTSREEAAQAALHVLEQNSFVCQSPIISEPERTIHE